MGGALTPETLVYDLVTAGDPQLSPDGAVIDYTRTALDRETKSAVSHLWRCDSDDGTARQLTRDGERNSGARWSPDGTALAFVSDRGKRSAILNLPTPVGGEAHEL